MTSRGCLGRQGDVGGCGWVFDLHVHFLEFLALGSSFEVWCVGVWVCVGGWGGGSVGVSGVLNLIWTIWTLFEKDSPRNLF